MKGNFRHHLALIAANLFFGLNYVFSKIVIPDYVSPEGLTMLRLSSAAILFWIALGLFFKRDRIEKGDYWKLVVASLLGMAINQGSVLKGLEFTTPVDAAIITTSGPVLVLLLSAFILRERITAVKLTGIVMGAAGALFLIMQGASNFGSGQFSGNVLVFISALSYALYFIWSKPLVEKYGPITLMAWQFLFASLITAPLFGMDLVTTDWTAIPAKIWLAIAFILLCATFGAYLCTAFGLKKVKPAPASIYAYLQPVVAATVSIASGQERLDWVKVVSALLVFTGVFLVTQSARFEKPALKTR